VRPGDEHLKSAPGRIGGESSFVRPGEVLAARDDSGFDAFAPVVGDAFDIEHGEWRER
jgi:hypothetical protein